MKGKQIAVFNINGDFFAIDNMCTHEEASLAEGEISGHEVTCPLHGAKFDVRTGEAIAAPEAEAAGEAKAEEKLRPPCTLVIFGASGDLTRRLLAPAIAHLSRDGAISPEFAIIGLARTEYSDQDFRA